MQRTIVLNGSKLTEILVDGRWLVIRVEPAGSGL